MKKISSIQNPAVKEVRKLSKRATRDKTGHLVVEGYRELKRAMQFGWRPHRLFFCPSMFQGKNEQALIDQAEDLDAEMLECEAAVLGKLAYRDRPEGLLAVGPHVRWNLSDLQLSPAPLVLIAENIEKPGNLGTMLRSADAAGVDAVLVCDRRTDINNPNVVRASIGTLFVVPVVEVSSEKAMAWLESKNIRWLAASPHADTRYTDADMRAGTALVVGAEQVGLSAGWLKESSRSVQIPMRGNVDSLNVAAAATILLFEAVRQRAG